MGRNNSLNSVQESETLIQQWQRAIQYSTAFIYPGPTYTSASWNQHAFDKSSTREASQTHLGDVVMLAQTLQLLVEVGHTLLVRLGRSLGSLLK